MFWKNKKPSAAKSNAIKRETIPSIISKDLNFLGNIISDGNIDFNGTIQGNIRCKTLTIRPEGCVNGDITAENLLVYGKINGLIRVKNAEFFASCQVEGVIMHETLTIEDGAFIDGKLKRTDRVHLDETSETDESSSSSFEAPVAGTKKPMDTIRLIR